MEMSSKCQVTDIQNILQNVYYDSGKIGTPAGIILCYSFRVSFKRLQVTGWLFKTVCKVTMFIAAKQLRESHYFHVLCESYCEKFFFLKTEHLYRVRTLSWTSEMMPAFVDFLNVGNFKLIIQNTCFIVKYCFICFLHCFIHNKTGKFATIFTKQ